MGVDYFDCPRCGISICDCGLFHSCANCYIDFCTDCYKELKNKGLEINNDKEFVFCCYCTTNKKYKEVSDEEFID